MKCHLNTPITAKLWQAWKSDKLKIRIDTSPADAAECLIYEPSAL